MLEAYRETNPGLYGLIEQIRAVAPVDSLR